LIRFDRSSNDLKRSFSSVNKPDITADVVDAILDGFEFMTNGVDDDDADDDEVEA